MPRKRGGVQAVRNGADATELTAFGEWFGAGKLGDDWELQQLITALNLAGRIESEHDALPRLAALAPSHTSTCLTALEAWVRTSPHSRTLQHQEKDIRAVVRPAWPAAMPQIPKRPPLSRASASQQASTCARPSLAIGDKGSAVISFLDPKQQTTGRSATTRGHVRACRTLAQNDGQATWLVSAGRHGLGPQLPADSQAIAATAPAVSEPSRGCLRRTWADGLAVMTEFSPRTVGNSWPSQSGPGPPQPLRQHLGHQNRPASIR